MQTPVDFVMKAKLPLIGVLVLPLALTGCGGGGGAQIIPDIQDPGIGTTPPRLPPPPPPQVLPSIPAELTHPNIQSVLPPETTKVRVGVIDSGFMVNHHRLAGSIEATHISSGVASIEDTGIFFYHGTPVAQIIANNTANERLLVSRASGRNGSFFFEFNDILTSTTWANSQGSRINNYSISGMFNLNTPHIRQIYQNNFANNVISVVAAGNENSNLSAPYNVSPPGTFITVFTDPVLYRGVLAVGAIRATGDKQSYSNFPGENPAIQRRFLVATTPVQVETADSTAGNRRIESKSGTSFAAPVVTAAATTLRAKWPHLDAASITNILLQTADRTFSPAYQRNNCGEQHNVNCGLFTFGMGRLDLYRALQPVGPVSVPTGTQVGEGSNIAQTHIRLPGVFGDARPAGVATAVFDGYGRDFKVDLQHLTQGSNSNISKNQMLMNMQGNSVVNTERTSSGELSTQLQFAPGRQTPEFSYIEFKGQQYGFNFSTANRMGEFMQTRRQFTPTLLSFNENSVLNSYDNAATFGASVRLSPLINFTAQSTVASTTPKTNFEQGFSQNQRSAEFHSLGFNFTPSENTRIGVGFEQVIEHSGAHGQNGFGALSFSNSNTQSINFNFNQRIGNGWSSFGMFRFGQMNIQGEQMLKRISNARTSEFAVGATWQGQKSQFTMSLVQPNRVDSATAHFQTAKGRAADGRVVYMEQQTGLNTSGTQHNLELLFNHQLDRNENVSLAIVHKTNPGHSIRTNDQTFIGATYNIRW